MRWKALSVSGLMARRSSDSSRSCRSSGGRGAIGRALRSIGYCLRSDKVLTQHLAERALRDLVAELDELRHLIAREPTLAESDEILGVHRPLADDHRLDGLLAGDPTRHADDDSFAHLGVAREHVLHFHGINLVAGNLDEQALPTGDPQPAGGVDPPQVACEEKPVSKDLAIVVVHAVIAVRHGGGADGDFAHEVCRNGLAGLVDDPNVNALDGVPDRGHRGRGSGVEVDGEGAGFRAAVELADRHPEACLKRGIRLRRECGASRIAEAQRRQVDVVRDVGEQAEEERNAREHSDAFTTQHFERPQALEQERVRVFQDDQRGAAANRRQHAVALAVGVEEGDGAKDAVRRRERRRRHHVGGLGHEGSVRARDALRAPRRAGRVLIDGIDLERLRRKGPRWVCGDERRVSGHAGVRSARRHNGNNGLAARDAARAEGSMTRVGDDQADAAVAEVEGELFLLEGGVERDSHGTERGDGQKCRDELRGVGLHDRHPVAVHHAERA